MQNKMFDYLRIALYAILVGIIVILFQTWDKDHPKPQMIQPAVETPSATTDSYVPEVPTTAQTAAHPVSAVSTPAVNDVSKRLVHITTDVFNVDIDPVGGNIVQVKLIKYPEALHSSNGYILLNGSPDSRYIAQSGLLSQTGPDTKQGQAMYTTEQTEYTLANNEKELQVKLNWQNPQGLKIAKIFTFRPDNYEIDMSYQINNQSSTAWDGNLYTQLMRTNKQTEEKQGFVSFATYFGAAISSPEKRFEKITFKQMGETNINRTITGGWAAMVQHYFVSAWVPEANTTSQYFSRITPDGLYTIGMIGPKLTVSPGQTVSTQSKFYAGPAIADNLEKVAPGLQLTIDYGWFWFIAIIIFWMMQHIHSLVGNWGWSIVLVTLVIKLMFYHLSAKSYRSMSMLKKLQPKINQIKERFGDDKQKFTQATLELYRKEKVNPMSGCLPILIQIPVFIGLYWVLIESVQLRQAPFILWIQDLSIKDPYYVLPILMGLSMFFQQRLNPPPPDPMQAKIMMLMPIIFTAMFVNFPAGLMLYWFVNNSLSFLQQWYIMHSITKADPKKTTKK